jgi:hypothetical protein
MKEKMLVFIGIMTLFNSCTTIQKEATNKNVLVRQLKITNSTALEILEVYSEIIPPDNPNVIEYNRIKKSPKVTFDHINHVGNVEVNKKYDEQYLVIKLGHGDITEKELRIRISTVKNDMIDLIVYKDNDYKISSTKEYNDNIEYERIREQRRLYGYEHELMITVISACDVPFFVIDKGRNKYEVIKRNFAQYRTTYFCKNGKTENYTLNIEENGQLYSIIIPTVNEPYTYFVYIKGFTLSGEIYYVISPYQLSPQDY